MSKRSKVSPLLYIIGISIVVVATIGAVLVVLRPSDSGEPAKGAGGSEGWVVIDGWSWEMMSGRAEVTIQGAVVNTKFRPGTMEDVKVLLRNDPAAMRNVVARVMTADPTLSCNTGGCTAGGKKLNLEGAVSPTSPVLKAAGVEHGFYVARPDTTGSTSFGVKSGSSKITKTIGTSVNPGAGSSSSSGGATNPGGASTTTTPGPDILPAPGPGSGEAQVPTQEQLQEELGTGGIDLNNPKYQTGHTDIPNTQNPDYGAAPTITAPPFAPQITPSTTPPPAEEEQPVGVEQSTPDPAQSVSQDASASAASYSVAVKAASISSGDPVGASAVDSTDTPASAQQNTGVSSSTVKSAPTTTGKQSRSEKSPVLAVGFAWGIVFELDSGWLSSNVPTVAPLGMQRDSVAPVTTDPSVQAAPFVKGLAHKEPSAAALSYTQLTAWSSPLFGCVIGAVCSKTDDSVKITNLMKPVAVRLCYSASILSGVDPELASKLRFPVNVVLRSREMKFSDAETRVQLGAWDPDVEVPDGVLWPVPPPVMGSNSTLRLNTAEVYDDKGLLLITGSQSFEVASEWSVQELVKFTSTMLTECQG